MSQTPNRQSIQDLELENSEEISLYLELIRIIEKDIDEIKEGDAKSGWTSWAVLGGLAAALMLFFGETRKLQTFPFEEVKVIMIGGILLLQSANLFIRAFKINQAGPRLGRIRWSKDVSFPDIPLWIYQILIYSLLIFVATTLSLPLWLKIIVIATLAYSTLARLAVLTFGVKKLPLGGSRLARKRGLQMFLPLIPVSIISVFLLANHMPFPVGEAATLPYILSGLAIAILLLISNLITTMAPSRLLHNLEELRNDIIFLRIEIDEALRRYETLTEGETLPDALREELGEVLTGLDVVEYAHSNMSALLKKMIDEVPLHEDGPGIRKQKLEQFSLDKDSYALHEAKCIEVLKPLGMKYQDLQKKLDMYSTVAEDWAGANTIRYSLGQRIQKLSAEEAQLKQQAGVVEQQLRQALNEGTSDISRLP